MARTFHALRSVPLGFDAARSYVFRVALPAAVYPTPAANSGFVARALETVGALPGVQAVGIISKLPLDDEARSDTAVFVEDRPLAMAAMPNLHQVVYVTPGTFAALGVPLLEGRTFEAPDPARAPLEVVVTRALARRYWGDGPAVGKRLRVAPLGPWFTVIGVTADIRGTRVDQPPDETVYLPFVTAPGPAMPDGSAGAARWTPRNLAFVVRSAEDLGAVAPPVERLFRVLAPAIPLYGVRSMTAVVDRSTARTSFTLELLEIASVASLLIGAVGLYGVVAYIVSLRTREMAIRVALGAEPARLQRQVLGEAVALTGVGVAVGLGAAVVLTPFLSALLYQVAPTDPVTLAAATTLMLGVSLVASWIPARRAAATAPASALRVDG
jgi:predicted permease